MDANRVSFPVNGTETEAYLAVPEGGSGPGVIVIQYAASENPAIGACVNY